MDVSPADLERQRGLGIGHQTEIMEDRIHEDRGKQCALSIHIRDNL